MIKVVMIIWGAVGGAGGLTSEQVTMDQCKYVQEQAKELRVFCLPLDREKVKKIKDKLPKKK